MFWKKTRAAGALAVLILAASETVNRAAAQDLQIYSRAQLNQMVKRARDVDGYRLLAAAFRHREQKFRAAAQEKMDDYAGCVRNLSVAPKFMTRPDADIRLFQYYSFEADRNARRALHYEELLRGRGIDPESRWIVSAQSLASRQAKPDR